MASPLEKIARKDPARFDADEEAKNSSWFKALGRYQAKGMSEKEIGKSRLAYQGRQSTDGVQSLASRSKKK